jgi:hypothetical protein
MRNIRFLPFLLALPLAACGGDDDGASPDASTQDPDADNSPDAAPSACHEVDSPTATIAVPGDYSGTITGGGADLTAPEGACAQEGADPDSPFWWEEAGEDVVVQLTGLTAGSVYTVDLVATDEDDLGFYVITGCDNGAPGTGQCPLFVDDMLAGEFWGFEATGTTAYVVVDTGAESVTTGAFTLNVELATCSTNDDCDGATPACVSFQCVQCAESLDCTGAAMPFCDTTTNACTAGPATCVGDDTGDTVGSDDGPAGARDLTSLSGVAQVASVCAASGEADYYKVTVDAGEGLTINLDWTPTAANEDLDVFVTDATGTAYGFSYWKEPELVTLTYLPAGTYYIEITQFASAASNVVVPYTLTVTQTADQTCTDADDCDDAFSTQLYRGSCDVADGACKEIPAGAGAANAACDSNDDCTSGACSYVAFEADAHLSVCTVECAAEGDCATITGTHCFAAAGICTPACTTNNQCGANIGSSAVDAGEPWNYATCTVATSTCTFP